MKKLHCPEHYLQVFLDAAKSRVQHFCSIYPLYFAAQRSATSAFPAFFPETIPFWCPLCSKGIKISW